MSLQPSKLPTPVAGSVPLAGPFVSVFWRALALDTANLAGWSTTSEPRLGTPAAGRSPSMLMAVAGLLIALCCSFALVGAIALLADLTPNEPGWRFASPLSVATVLVLGVLFYWVRRRARLIYGLAEICFALTIAWVRAPDFQADMVRTTEGQDVALALTAAGVYVLVRGLDSCATGLAKYTAEADAPSK